MIATSTQPRRLEISVLRRFGQRCGVTSWPVVLDLWPDCDDAASAHRDAMAHDRVIEDADLMEAGGPTLWADTVLGVLAHPERQLEIRRFTPEGVVRICLARRGHDHVLAVRDAAGVDLRVVEVCDVAALAGIVRRLCGPPDAMEFAEVNVLTSELNEAMAVSDDASSISAALHFWGGRSSDVTRIADALITCHTRWEIVATAHVDGAVTQAGGALGIVDSRHGRILFGPSKSPDGRWWTTITPGSGHRIGQAVKRLTETLPHGGWFP